MTGINFDHDMMSASMRLKIWQLRVGAFLSAALIQATFVISNGRADDDEEAAVQEQPSETRDAAVVMRREADAALRGKIAIVDRICELTDAQKQKLELAGQGDIKKLLASGMGPDRLRRLWRRPRLVGPASPRDESLFFKLLDRILTAEQAQKYSALRPVLRAGGWISLGRSGEIETVEINLTGIEFGDDDLAHLADWPRLPALYSLNLAGTNVTDAGLKNLKRLSQLRHLDLSRTAMTDSGLNDLQSLSRLKHLTLQGLSERLGDAAVEDLKCASPALEIHW